MRGVLLGVLIAALGAGIVVPMGFLAGASLRAPDGSLSLINYVDVVTSPFFVGSLALTMSFCAATAALATLLALPTAWWIARRRGGARVLRTLCQVNFAFSGVVYGMLVLTLLGNSGVIAIVEATLIGTEYSRGAVYTTAGLALGYLGFQAPRAAILLTQAMERLDPAVISAARILGASTRQLGLLVILPQLYRPMATTFLAITLMSMASFGTALIIARTIEIFPVLIYREFIGFGEINRAAAMGVMLAVCCLALEAVARFVASRNAAGLTARGVR